MGWLDSLTAAADQIGQDIVAFLEYLLGLLVALFQYLYNLLVAVFQFFYHLAQIVAHFFITLWEDFFKRIFQAAWAAIVRVHAWLEKILAPIINFLKAARRWFDFIFNTYIKPFLSLLQHIRAFLNVLRSFGIQWAATLDKFLGQVQADITGALLKVQGYLNAIIGIVASLSDPLGLFRRPTFVMSMRRIFPSFVRGMTGMPMGFFFPSQRSGQPAWLAPTVPNFAQNTAANNPPPSGYLGSDDGLGTFGGVDQGTIMPDTAMDDMTPLDYFNDDTYPQTVQGAPADLLAQLQQAAYDAIAQQPA
jgi:hypothetical protein